MNNDEFLKMFSGVTGMDKTSHYCVKCNKVVKMLSVKTAMETNRKMFYCENNKCDRFGVIPVVVKK